MENTPNIIGPYKVIKLIGSGGMGVVYSCKHQNTGKIVALKTIKISAEGMLQSIRREIITLASLQHPGVVPIIDYGIQKGLPWYAMPFLKGITLHQLYNEYDQPNNYPKDNEKPYQNFQSLLLNNNHQDRIITLLHKICLTLAYIHGEGIIHRDLKPDNIFIQSGDKPVLIDFGLILKGYANISRDKLHVERGGFGTLSYVAPEQIRGELVDARADLYSFGCILYELLTGNPPFKGESVYQIMKLKLNKSIPPPSHIVNGVPYILDELVRRLLSKDPRKRPGYASDVASILQKLHHVKKDEYSFPTPRSYIYHSKFVGRPKQMLYLNKALAKLKQDNGNIITISGVSGTGKTRLALEFGRKAARDKVQVLTGVCNSMVSLTLEALRKPVQVIADRCLERSEAELKRVFAGNRAFIAQYIPGLAMLPEQDKVSLPTLSPPEAKLKLFDSLWQIFVAYTVEQPLLLIIDDLQWADDLLMGFLDFILKTKELTKTGILILTTIRSDEMSNKIRNVISQMNASILTLEPLSKDTIIKIIKDMLSVEKLSYGFTDFMVRSAEGNPFYIGEYLRAAIDEGFLQRDILGHWHLLSEKLDEVNNTSSLKLSLPESIMDLIERHLDGLPPVAAKLTEFAAVLGREFREIVVRSLSGLSAQDFFSILRELQQRSVLRRMKNGKIQFYHDKIREVAYQHIPPERRKRRHKIVAELMERQLSDHKEARFAELAMHWEKAGMNDEARKWYLKAAKFAKNIYSLQQAENFYRKYFKFVDEVSADTVLAHIELGQQVLLYAGKISEAYIEHEKALAEARQLNDKNLETSCVVLLGDVAWNRGHLDKASIYYKHALSMSRELNDVKTECKIQGNIAGIRYEMGYETEAHKLFLKTLQLARENEDREREGIILANLATLSRRKGDLNKALELYKQSLSLMNNFDDKRREGLTLSNIGNIYFDKKNYKKARSLYEKALTLAQQIGFRWNESVVLTNLGILFNEEENFEEAEQYITKAYQIADEMGNHRLEVISLMHLASFYAEQGIVKGAVSYNHKALKLVVELKDRRLEGEIYRNLAIFTRRTTNDFKQSEKYANKAENIFRETEDITNLLIVLCEHCFRMIAMDDISKLPTEEILLLTDQMENYKQGDFANTWKSLQEAFDAYKQKKFHLLYKGELKKEIPKGLRNYLIKNNMM